MDDLASEYDVIVIGTGMTESIVAAAASRVGKRVLHLDSNEYYGGMWASFNFDGLQKWLGECQDESIVLEHETTDNLLKDGESLVKAGSQFATVFNIEEKWYIGEDLVGKGGQPLHSKDTQTEGDGSQSKGDHDGDLEKGEKELSESEKEKETSSSKCWSQNKLKALYRKFNLDLAPKGMNASFFDNVMRRLLEQLSGSAAVTLATSLLPLGAQYEVDRATESSMRDLLLYARGSLVELLISSNIARYAEFRSVSRVLTYINNKLETVPCSRSDVFSTKEISVVEKRLLMQLLTLCHEYAKDPDNKEFQGFENKTFVEYLESKKLTPNLLHYVLYAIAMSTHKTPCMEGIERTQRFLTSLGRYGNTPFLWPMYGSGELPQCFCRLCAVFGGVYHLKRAANSVIVSQKSGEPHCAGIVSGSQRLTTEHLVMAVSDAPKSFLKSAPKGGLSRGIFITDRSIQAGNKELLTLLQFPPQDPNGEIVTVIEVGPSTNACPQNLYIVHMTCRQVKSAKDDLALAVSTLLHTEPCEGIYRSDTQSQATITPKHEGTSETEGENISQPECQSVKPQLLWSLYFNCPETSSCDLSADVPTNVHLCSGPDLDLDFEFSVKQAKEVFKKMYPECEFLPRAPDPEEIVLDDDSQPGPAFSDKTESESDKQDTTSTTAE